MTTKKRVGVICGGQSAEHEVSLQSAKSIVEAMDHNKYEIEVIGLHKDGKWVCYPPDGFLENPEDPNTIRLAQGTARLAVVPGEKGRPLLDLSTDRYLDPLDVIFPVLHGPFGEDGTVQGLLKLIDVPFVGAGVLGSGAGMDKDVTKRLLRDAGIPVAQCVVVERGAGNAPDFNEIKEALGLPLFVKPANLGSSVGVAKVDDEKEFHTALEKAFSYDDKLVIEEYIPGREIECSVLGNENPIASLPGEIITNTDRHGFYSYEAKYLDQEGAALMIPADLPGELVAAIQGLAVDSFKALSCEGMARADFFLTKDGKIFVNELNTIPGFTKNSMYPKLWEASGIPFSELLDRLIGFALDRHERERKRLTSLRP